MDSEQNIKVGGNNDTSVLRRYVSKAPAVYACSWSQRSDQPYRMAVGTFEEDYTNYIEVIQWDEQAREIKQVGSFDHPYPATKVMFMPSDDPSNKDLIVTCGDYLRMWTWSNEKGKVVDKVTLNHNKSTEFCAPLTSLDWSTLDLSLLVVSSVDTTCTAWDLVEQKPIAKLIAHDNDVYDVTLSYKDPKTFATVGGDRSLRIFDLRSLEHSTIIHEAAEPLLRVSWNKQDNNYLAVTGSEGNSVTIIDSRLPSMPLARLSGHGSALSSVDWAPQSSVHVASCGSDSRALIWDIGQGSENNGEINEAMLSYNASSPVNQIRWSNLHSEWLGITHGNTVEMLHV
ncbi:WD domain, G-beta repeat [Carpediemonas membranifera]|uniref:WD domain, G-beta repeat n=1 Tax=Carpediemonas membranifera TaxID=201153 RepID=A0A8J6AYS2_9EUKA|nr:WD domain, G-beta repeat [Carpediemonas membranifera]|eukprot:KAG9390544.1 WD domain, G-beta repeat [Carpediemonas membranifera]